MAQISIEELYRGEGSGAKYGSIMGAVVKEVLTNGIPAAYDEQTWIEMLIVKHTLITAERIKREGDFVSGITDIEPPSCCGEGTV